MAVVVAVRMRIGQNIKFTREHNFITYDYKKGHKYTSEYTIKSNVKEGATEVIILRRYFPLNLKIHDAGGNSLPILSFDEVIDRMTKESVNSEVPDHIRKIIPTMIYRLKNKMFYLICVKIPKLEYGKRTNIFLEHDMPISKGTHSVSNKLYGAYYAIFRNRKIGQHMEITPHETHYTIYAPNDFEMKIHSFEHFVYGKTKKIPKSKLKFLEEYKTSNSTTFTLKPSDSEKAITVNFKFKPSKNVVLPTNIALTVLIGIGAAMLFMNCLRNPNEVWFFESFFLYLNDTMLLDFLKPRFVVVLERNLEAGFFLIGSSILIPQLIRNPVIHRIYKYIYIIPVILGIGVLLW